MRHPSPLLSILVLMGAAVEAAVPQRCDLVSEAPKCLDLSSLNGATIQVPANTTRIPTSGLVLCGVAGSTPPPTDIAYVVDETGSMLPTAIQIHTEDTSGYFKDDGNGKPCNLPSLGTMNFHDATGVQILPDSLTEAQIEAVCSVAGDPYGVRSSVVQQAIATQAAQAPNSYAATVDFARNIILTQDSMTLLTPAGTAALQATVPNQYQGMTNYEAAITWARILLYGGSSGGNVIPPSKDPNKAIIMISDGRPNTGTWQNALKPTNTVTNVPGSAGTWTTGSTTIPPVYTIYLGVDTVEGSVLKTIAQQTKGVYFQIPPFMPDSLGRVIQKILGSLIKPAVPDTLVVQNLTNGQTSTATTSSSAGANAYRMNLDSLVGLDAGTNQLKLTLKESGQTITANWTVQVSGAGGASTKGADTLLTEQCGPASTLSIAPDKSGLAWADTADRNLVLTLKASPQGNADLPVSLSVVNSSDREVLPIPVPATAVEDSLGTFKGSIPWQFPVAAGPVPGDLVVRSGFGWDTAWGFFQMPRDKRDTASAKIALHHPTAPVLTLTPSVEGPFGQISAVVVDSESTSATIKVVVRHRLGDTLSVTLARGGDGIYRGTFSFAQGQTINLRDTVLQMGPLGGGLDSVTGTYRTSSSTSYVQASVVRLRFLNAQNLVVDSLGFDLPVGGQTTVQVQVWIGNSFCSSCGGLVAISPSSPALKIFSASGASVSSVRLSAGQLTVVVRGSSPLLLGNILFSSDSLATSVTAQPIRVLPPAPDSVVYQDVDGDGRLDRAILYSRMAWTTGTNLQLPWPDSAHFLPWQTASLSLSTDTHVVTFDLDPQGRDTTSWSRPLWAQWRWDAGFPWQSVPVKERLAPVPVRATLSWGTTVDTLRVWPSEGLWPSFPNLSQLVGRQSGANDPAVVPRSARLETGTGALVLTIPSDSTWFYVQPGDSVRFLSGVRDDSGNAPGRVAKHVVVEGTDPAPRDAVLLDTDADGRADRLVVHLRSPLHVSENVVVQWPDTFGVLQTRTVAVASGVSDSDGLVMSWSLEPFAFGATSCPVAGCGSLGALTTTRFGAEVRTSFAVRDGVDPIPLSAAYRYSEDGTTSDTLVVRYSEAVQGGANPWVSLGSPGLDSLGRPLVPAGKLGPAGAGSRTVWFLVDSATGIHDGDSLRISSKDAGGTLGDLSGNQPGRLAWWTPIEWGAPPPVLHLVVPYAIALTLETEVPASEPPISILIRKASDGAWVPADGNGPQGLGTPGGEARLSGVVVRLNRIPEGLGMYVYDNMGVLVLNRDLSDLATLAQAGAIPRTRRGDYEVWLAWDGKDGAGRLASTGIYRVRVYGWVKDEGKLLLLNQLRTLGFKTGTK